jgi:tRNA nucleotidyltransferase (CCA-adding enzyme)
MGNVTHIDAQSLRARLGGLPGAGALLGAGREDVYLVGGAVRDLLLRDAHIDVDLAVDGDPAPLAAELGEVIRVHERFGTVSVLVGADEIDVARTRTETYSRPGALPEVSWAGLEDDLGRRDFTVNAMAVALGAEPRLIDLHGGLADLSEGRLRVLHERSFEDDPTRAIRAARYATRLGFALEPKTEELVRDAELATVSADRVEAELRRVAGEPDPVEAIRLLRSWGLIDADVEALEAAWPLLGRGSWSAIADRSVAVLEVAGVDAGKFKAHSAAPGARLLAATSSTRPSELTAAAWGRRPSELILARALGAEWLDSYLEDWRHVRLDIDGSDLLEADIPQGPGIGRGLAAALRAKLDGEVEGREGELDTARRAALQ